MDRAPLPPHERPWRHPSELGPPEHEPTTTTGRVLIVTTATLSLALIGLLVLTVTPDRSPGPSSAGAETTRGPTVTFAALERPTLPMVTPIGDDGWGVTTTGAVAGRSGMLSARLPSGDVVDVEIVTTDKESGLTVVSLPDREPGYQLAKGSPAPSDTVLVNGEPPRVVAMDELATLDVDEGTPVLDDDGDLIGLCTDGDTGTMLRTVATMPSTSVPRPPPTSAPTTAAPTTSVPATTSVPPTTAATTTTTTTPTTTSITPPTTAAGASASTVSGGGGASGAPG